MFETFVNSKFVQILQGVYLRAVNLLKGAGYHQQEASLPPGNLISMLLAADAPQVNIPPYLISAPATLPTEPFRTSIAMPAG